MNKEKPFGIRLSMLHRASKKFIDEQIKAEELTGVQLFVLGQLRRMEDAGVGEVNQKDLEKASHVTHPTMTELLKRLERKGFVKCERSRTDRRYKCVSATDRVKDIDRSMREADEKTFAQLCQGLSDEQISQFLAITDVMVANAERILEKGCDCDGFKNPCKEPEGI